MSKKQPRFCAPNAHRPVNWNERAVRRAIERDGYVLVQAKEDGFRFHAFLQDGVRIVTREGIEIRSLDKAKQALQDLLEALPDDFVVDGEVTVPGMPFEEASGHLRRFQEIEHRVEFHVWDTFPFDALTDGNGYSRDYSDRLEELSDAVPSPWVGEPADDVFLIETWPAHSLDEVRSTYDAFRKAGLEGAVVKEAFAPVRNGKVTGQWKLKPSDTADGRVVGLVWGTPGLGNAGKVVGFTVELESGVLCDVTGITQAQMDKFTQMVEDGSRCDLLGRYVEVSYMELTRDGSLRHPRFERFRDLDYSPGWKA